MKLRSLLHVCLFGLCLPYSFAAENDPFVKFWDSTDEEFFLILRDTEPKLLIAWMRVMVRSQTPAKRATCAIALGYDRCFYDATELFGKEYRVKMLKVLLQDKDLDVRRSAIQSCQAVFASEARSLLPMLEKMKKQQGLNAAEKQHLAFTLERLKKLK